MKKISQIKGMSQLKPLAHSRPRTIPVQHRSPQTELYMLRKEKERYLKEAERLEKRYLYVKEKLAKIDNEMGGLIKLWEKEMDAVKSEASTKISGGPASGGNSSTGGNSGNVHWKRRELKY